MYSFLYIVQKPMPQKKKNYKCVHMHNAEVWLYYIFSLKWRRFKSRESPEFGYVIEVHIRESHQYVFTKAQYRCDSSQGND